MRGLLTLLTFAILAVPAWAATGDNSPPIPISYKHDHPRLPSPADGTYLADLWDEAPGSCAATTCAAYKTAATNWSSTAPGNMLNFRRLLIYYLACKAQSCADEATMLTKLTDLIGNFQGRWGNLKLSVSDGVADGTTAVTSATGGFTSGCDGGSCAGYVLIDRTRAYTIVSVTNDNTIVVNFTVPSGTSLEFRVISSLAGRSANALELAMLYDWIYDDLTAQQKSDLSDQLSVHSTLWQEDVVANGGTCYNDQMWTRNGYDALTVAVANYAGVPNDIDDTTAGLTNLKYALEIWLVNCLPVWHQALQEDGGGWYESWADYINSPTSNMAQWVVTPLLSWQTASQTPFFADHPWLRYFGYQTIYMLRPDYLLEKLGDVPGGHLTEEYTFSVGATDPGMLSGLAEIYNDPVLRFWARRVNLMGNPPSNNFEPSAYPFYEPDDSSKTATDPTSTLDTTHNFAGWGVLTVRSGWGEDDTFVTFKYGDNFWSHEHMDTGSFTIFKRGNLAIDSGTSRSGSTSKHHQQYNVQTLAHNSILICDPADAYATETLVHADEFLVTQNLTIANDCGQRRVGSPFNGIKIGGVTIPDSVAMNMTGKHMPAWINNIDYYRTGKLIHYTDNASFTYAAVDMTAAYANSGSASTVMRTNRATKVIRHFLFIPRGEDAYVVTFDHVVSTNATFDKKWLIHSVNQPTITSNKFEITRGETVTATPFADLWPQRWGSVLTYDLSASTYDYDGLLTGWVLHPATATLTNVGGTDSEFYIDDPASPGNGTNWNQCHPTQCTSNQGSHSGDGTVGPFNISAGTNDAAKFSVDGGGDVDCTLTAGAARTADQVVGDLNTCFTGAAAGATAVNNNGRVAVQSDSTGGATSTIQVKAVANDSYTALGWTEGTYAGSGTEWVRGTIAQIMHPSALQGPVEAGAWRLEVEPSVEATEDFFLTVMLATTTGETDIPASMTARNVGNTHGATWSDTNCTFTIDFNDDDSGGTYVVTGGACGITANTTLTAGEIPVPGSISAYSGDGQSSPATTAVFFPLVAQVSDQNGSPLDGWGVEFAVTSGNGTLTNYITTTNAQGLAYTRLTLGTGSVSSTVTVDAIATGVGNATFTTTISAAATGTAIPTNEWVQVDTHGPPVQGVGWENLVYVSALKKHCFQGNYHEIGSEPNQSLHCFDVEAMRWDIVNIGNLFHTEDFPEAGHPSSGFVYDPVQNVIIEYCCNSGANQPENLYRGHWQDIEGMTGRDKHTSPKFGTAIAQSASAFDPANRVMVLFGGGSSVGTWIYDPITNTWDQKTGGDAPTCAPTAGDCPNTSTILPSMAYRNADGRIYMFGGSLGTGPGRTLVDDLYAYDVAANEWERIIPATTKPPGRDFHGIAYDSTNDIILLQSGQDASTNYNDTWAYDFSTGDWADQSPAASPPGGGFSRVFDHLSYDPVSNVFVLVVDSQSDGYADGTWTTYGITTYFYRYAGSGPSVGIAPIATVNPTGSINANVDGWAKEPSLATDGTTLYAAFTETGQPFDTSTAFPAHTQVASWDGASWTHFGGLAALYNPAQSSESYEPSLAVVGSTLWASWAQYIYSVETVRVYAGFYSGGTWTTAAIGRVNDVAGYFQGRSMLANVNGTAHIVFLENNRTSNPHTSNIYVKQWNGSAWVLVGSGALNRVPGAGSTADSLSITSDGTNPCVAWTEYTRTSASVDGVPQVYAACWNGSAWSDLGGALNVSGTAWATDASITYMGQPYVAWTERTVTGNPQLYVKTWNGATWDLVGTGALNRASGWAYRPSLTNDGTNLFLGWAEQEALGQRPQAYVSEYTGGAWVSLGSSLNNDIALGSAQRVRLAIFGGQPVAIWGEVEYTQMRNIYVTQWDGAAWDALASPAAGVQYCCRVSLSP